MPKTPIKKYIDKNGVQTYYFSIRLGKKVTKRRGFLDRADAEAAYFNLKQQYLNGDFETSNNQISYNDMEEKWFQTYKATVRPTSYRQTKKVFHANISPFFEDKKLAEIDMEDCQKAVNYWIENLAQYKLPYYYLRRVFNLAIKNGYINSNPLDKIDLPKTTTHLKKVQYNRKKENFYNRDELERFLKKAHDIDFTYYVFFRLIAYSGMRIGEMLALRWDDVIFKTNHIEISKSLAYNDQSKEFELGPTKGGKTRRIIMDQTTMDILKKWHEYLNIANHLVDFTLFPINKNYMKADEPAKWQRNLNTAIGIKRSISLHGFRHTNATLLYDMNPDITPKDVQYRLGHADANLTMNIYEHRTEHSDDKIIKALKKF